MANYIKDVGWLLDAAVVNLAESAVEASIKTNADFHSSAGLRPKVVRKSSGSCCPWCDSLEGEYDYPNVPREVWQRHERCNCVVEYDPGDGRRQDVYTKKWREQAERKKRIEFAEKALDSLIIKHEPIQILKAIGAAARNYNVKLPDGRKGQFASGTSITKIVPIAGKGTNTELRVASKLESMFGIKAEKWTKYRGEGIIRDEGENRRAEVHWYEAEDEQVLMKVKRWF